MIDKNTIKKLAEISEIAFTKEELDEISASVSDIIAVIERISDADINNDFQNTYIEQYNNLREDITAKSAKTEELLSNAQTVKNRGFCVPKIV